MGWLDYKAEAEVLLPGYDSYASRLQIRANGNHCGAYVQRVQRGRTKLTI